MRHVLELPWGEKGEALKAQHGLKPLRGGFLLYSGVLLPRSLRPYAVEEFTYGRWLEDEENAHVSMPEAHEHPAPLTPQELAAAAFVRQAHEAKRAGVLLQAPLHQVPYRGLLQAVAEAAAALSEEFDAEEEPLRRKLLIVTEKASVTTWVEALKESPRALALVRPLIVTPGQLGKLLKAPATARVAATKSAKERVAAHRGVSSINWDFILFDGLPALGTDKTLAATVGQLLKNSKPYKLGATPFAVVTLQEVARSPLDYSPFSNFMSEALTQSRLRRGESFEARLASRKWAVREGARGWTWGMRGKGLTPEQQVDLIRLRKLFAQEGPYFLPVASEAGPTLLVPHRLTGWSREHYLQSWRAFRQWMNKHPKQAAKGPWQEQLALHSRTVTLAKLDAVVELALEACQGHRRTVLLVQDAKAAERLQEKLLGRKQEVQLVTRAKYAREDWHAFSALGSGDHCILLLEAAVLEQLQAVDALQEEVTVLLPELFQEATYRQVEGKLMGARRATVLVPLLTRTLEESLYPRLLKERLTPVQVENHFRKAAALTTPPNRLS